MMRSFGRKAFLVGLLLAMVLGFAIYSRLWSIDYTISSIDGQLLRRQFDLANREAMDESAEWRRRFDEESERAAACEKELREVKGSLHEKGDHSSNINEKLAQLLKERSALLKQVERLKAELEAEKMKCKSGRAER